MDYRLKLRAQARNEFLDAVDWYAVENHKLGAKFTSAIDGVLESIKENPFKYAVVYRDLRRALAHRFPYGVYFRVDDDCILILAIVHMARNPRVWMDRA